MYIRSRELCTGSVDESRNHACLCRNTHTPTENTQNVSKLSNIYINSFLYINVDCN